MENPHNPDPRVSITTEENNVKIVSTAPDSLPLGSSGSNVRYNVGNNNASFVNPGYLQVVRDTNISSTSIVAGVEIKKMYNSSFDWEEYPIDENLIIFIKDTGDIHTFGDVPAKVTGKSNATAWGSGNASVFEGIATTKGKGNAYAYTKHGIAIADGDGGAFIHEEAIGVSQKRKITILRPMKYYKTELDNDPVLK